MAKTMVFLDSRVNDLDLLVSQFDAGTEYKVLDASYDGLLQMEESLAGKSDYSSIQVISHGAAGAITIGSTVLNSNNLLQYQLQLNNIGHALTDSGDLLLYGCNVGAGETGLHFVETLAQLTGADVAASDDVTGGVAVGGDWVLESATGPIESVVPVAEEDLQQYDYTLGVVDDYILAQMSLVAYYDNPDLPGLIESDSTKAEIAKNAWVELRDAGWYILEAKGNDLGDWTKYPTKPTFEDSSWGFFNSGFAATVFGNIKENKIVIAYRGTDDNNDFIGADLAIGSVLLNAWNKQFDDALKVAASIKSAFNGFQIEVTGHSLGGGLAQIVSQMFNFSGAAFDPGGAKNVAEGYDFNLYASDHNLPQQDINRLAGIGAPVSFKSYLVEASPISGIPGFTNDHIGATKTLQKDELIDFIQQYTADHPTKSLLDLMKLGLSFPKDYVDYAHYMGGIMEFMRDKVNHQDLNYYGTSGADTVSMNNNANHIYGYAGNDSLSAGGGNDTVDAGYGNDTIRGDDGDDSINGNNGNDTISGNGGNDTIDGGSGNDTAVFSGNFADYSITLDKNSLVFTVTDSVSGRDGTDQLTHVEAFAFADGTWQAGDACTVVNGSYRNEYLYGNDLDNHLLGDGGNDVLEGKRGNDTIDGGRGTDTVVFSGNYSEYNIYGDSGTYTVTDSVVDRDGIDTITGVEYFRFNDRGELVLAPTGNETTIESVAAQNMNTSTPMFPGHTFGEFANQGAFAALRADGSVITWGWNGYGGDSTALSVQLNGDIDVMQVFSTWEAFAALRVDGSVVTWGSGFAGGNSSAVSAQLNGDIDVMQVFSSVHAFAALRENGSVVTWGGSDYGGNSSPVSAQLNGDIDVMQVFSTQGAFAALRVDGSVVTWGGRDYGGDSSAVSAQLNGDIDVKQVFSAGYAFAALREDGSVITWGLSYGGANSSAVSAKLNGDIDVTQVFPTYQTFAALLADGSVVTWGLNYVGGDSSVVSAQLNGDIDVMQVFSTHDAFAALRADGSVVTWGYTKDGGDSNSVSALLNGDIDVTQVFLTFGAFAALRKDGSVVIWGNSDYGGDSSAVSARLNGDIDVTQVFSTQGAFAALREDGSVVTWGAAADGGDSSAVSAKLNGDIDVMQVFSSVHAFAALRKDGSVVTWGHPRDGGDSSAVSAQLVNVVDISNIFTDIPHDRILTGTEGDNKLDGSIGNDILFGNLGNDRLSGKAGDDLAFGGLGNDLFIGGEGEGDDTYVGGDGIDSVKYTSALAGITVDLAEGTAYSTDGNNAAAIGTDVLIDIENVIAGNFNDILIGNASANSLEGGAGDDWLLDGEGADTLDGGPGSDTADYSEKAVALIVTLNGAVDATVMVGGVAEDTICNIENLIGGSGNDIFTGDSADNLFRGGSGNDTLDGGIGLDTADYSDKTEAVSVTLHGSFDALVTVGGVAEDTIRNIENLIGGSGNDTFIGDAMANNLSGGEGDDTLQGGAGNDTLNGGFDDDTVLFSGNLAEYSIIYDFKNKTYTVTDSVSDRDGIDLVTGAEFFQFADGIHPVADLVDIAPPYLQAITPSEYATNVAVGADIVFTFTEPVQAGTGSILLQTGGTTVMTIDVTDTGQVSFNGSTLTLNPSANFAFDTEYTVSIGAEAIADLAGNSFAGTDAYDFTTAAAASLHDLNGSVTFWKTGLPITAITSTLASTPAVAGAQPIEFRNIQTAADGSRTLEIWETSPTAAINSVLLEIALPTGSTPTWQDATALPSGWNSSANTDKPGQFILGGIGTTALSTGSIKLGTLTLTAPANPQHFELSLTTGQLGNDAIPAFALSSDSMATGTDGLYQHLDMADGAYSLTSAKVSGTAESSAVKANDALAALKIAVGMNPNADGSAVSPYQYLAADVNHDGQVKAADALNILKMAVKLSTAPEMEWLFVPESVGSESMSRTHVVWPDNPMPVTLDMDQDVNLIGIVKGDVDGSWSAVG